MGGRRPRGAAFSWYTYSPTRVRYPYVRGVLLEMYREAKQRLGDPVLVWADVTSDPVWRRRYQSARGKGGLVRAGWPEAVEMIAAAYVNATRPTAGPGRRLLAYSGDVDVTSPACTPRTPSPRRRGWAGCRSIPSSTPIRSIWAEPASLAELADQSTAAVDAGQAGDAGACRLPAHRGQPVHPR